MFHLSSPPSTVSLKQKESIALKRFQTFKPDSLGFSGGKDSVVCDHLFQRSGLPYHAFMNLTTVDPKIHIQFVKHYFPHVELLHPEHGISMFSLIVEKGLPNRRIRFCCEYLKERVQRGTFVVFGIRQAEGTGAKTSKSRKTRPMFHYHPKQNRLKVLNPIIDWSDHDVWEYIRRYQLPISPLYGPPYFFTRVGCIGCPMAGKTVQRQIRLFPEYQRYYLKAIQRRMEKGFFRDFDTPEQVFQWWISQTSTRQFLAQGDLFCMDN